MSAQTKTRPRIGIYSGTFDPVHAGHISFALQAIDAAKLDKLYFLPERRPRNKVGVEHFGHRVAMLKRASKPHKKLAVLELEDVSFSVAQTLPRIKKRFNNAQLVFLTGSDVIQYMPTWPNVTEMLKQTELVVGLRSTDDSSTVGALMQTWSVAPISTTMIVSCAPQVSSRKVREGLRRREYVPGLLQSVWRYSERNWLYISLAQRL
jgi:nicotinate-nucleotide adenylyltransferase